MERVQDFLGLDRELTASSFVHSPAKKNFYCFATPRSTSTSCLPPNKGRTYDTDYPDTARRLARFYAPYNERLFHILGARFEWPTYE